MSTAAPDSGTQRGGLQSQWKYVADNVIVYRDAYRGIRAFEASREHALAKAQRAKSVAARGALSPFTLAPETPARKSCHRDKSDHAHPVPKRLSVGA